MDKSTYENVYAAGGTELVAYTEYREHIKTCELCKALGIDDEMTCLAGLRLLEFWQQKQLESMRATLMATGDFIEGYH